MTINNWINIKDKPPPDAVDVLVCLHDIRHGCEEDYYFTQAYYYKGKWEYIFYCDDMSDFEVIAWTPSPEPPLISCACYHIINGQPVCYGTKECDPCSCNGNKRNCTFYPKNRKEII